MKKDNKGFTVIEVIVSITVLAIVIFIAIPFVTDMILETRKKTLLDETNLLWDKAVAECVVNNPQKIDINESDDYQASAVERGFIDQQADCYIEMVAYDGIWCLKRNPEKHEPVISNISEEECFE